MRDRVWAGVLEGRVGGIGFRITHDGLVIEWYQTKGLK